MKPLRFHDKPESIPYCEYDLFIFIFFSFALLMDLSLLFPRIRLSQVRWGTWICTQNAVKAFIHKCQPTGPQILNPERCWKSREVQKAFQKLNMSLKDEMLNLPGRPHVYDVCVRFFYSGLETWKILQRIKITDNHAVKDCPVKNAPLSTKWLTIWKILINNSIFKI